MMDLFLTNMQFFTNWWTGVVWIIVMILSALDSHSVGTHSLQSTFLEHFHFGWTISSSVNHGAA